MSLPFFPGVPQGNQTIASSQANILANFASINSALNVPATLGAVTGGGNFSSYSFQSTMTQCTTIPTGLTAAVGVLATVPSKTNGFPELVWVNTGNTTGVTPFLPAAMTQITGGGITTAAWCQYDGTILGNHGVNEGYNVSTVTRNSAGNYTLNFTRNFASIGYAAVITPSANFTGTSILVNTRTISALTFTVLNGNTPTDSVDINVAIFGKLA